MSPSIICELNRCAGSGESGTSGPESSGAVMDSSIVMDRFG